MALFEIFLVVLALLAAYLIFKVVKNIFVLAINSIIGFFALFGFNTLFGSNIAINFWSVLITAIGGIIGFILVVASHYLGWAF